MSVSHSSRMATTILESRSLALFQRIPAQITRRRLSFMRREKLVKTEQRQNAFVASNQWMKIARGGFSNDTKVAKSKYRVYVAVGSNLGNRFDNIANALKMLCDPTFDGNNYGFTRLVRTSFLYSTSPMYVTDQPEFLNGAVEIETDMEPHALLNRLKMVEKSLGRDVNHGVRYGPRPVDLDILLYDQLQEDVPKPMLVDSSDLVIPHQLMQERDFVLTPLKEVTGENYYHPKLNVSIGTLLDQLKGSLESRNDADEDIAVRVIPLPKGRMLSFNETLVMGILNVTPDSFSDGGKWNESVDVAVQHALEMVSQGASIIDIGGESTRPGAKEIPIQEQIKRTIPVIEELRKVSDVVISIDTRHAAVARAAVQAGADIVNDVSGGRFDAEMLSVVSELKVPMILMHMRGTPESMQTMTEYKDDVCEEVAQALLERSHEAEDAGIHRWQQILDPGIGFAKDFSGNLLLLKHTATEIRTRLEGIPLLLGTSRKGFIGQITGETIAEERDFGSVASVITALCLGSSTPSNLGCNILRVHNVKGTKQATLVMDAISNVK